MTHKTGLPVTYISRWWNCWSARYYGMFRLCSGRYGVCSIMRGPTK